MGFSGDGCRPTAPIVPIETDRLLVLPPTRKLLVAGNSRPLLPVLESSERAPACGTIPGLAINQGSLLLLADPSSAMSRRRLMLETLRAFEPFLLVSLNPRASETIFAGPVSEKCAGKSGSIGTSSSPSASASPRTRGCPCPTLSLSLPCPAPRSRCVAYSRSRSNCDKSWEPVELPTLPLSSRNPPDFFGVCALRPQDRGVDRKDDEWRRLGAVEEAARVDEEGWWRARGEGASVEVSVKGREGVRRPLEGSADIFGAAQEPRSVNLGVD